MPISITYSPIGPLELEEKREKIVRVSWVSYPFAPDEPKTPLLKETCQALSDYFAGRAKPFQLPLLPNGSTFQKKVWRKIQAIPLGHTRTYRDLAISLGSAPRAVGMACAANPIPIIIPCHRVVSTTSLGGYSGGVGLETKVFLLHLEGAIIG